jgi:hypothetical protein
MPDMKECLVGVVLLLIGIFVAIFFGTLIHDAVRGVA